MRSRLLAVAVASIAALASPALPFKVGDDPTPFGPFGGAGFKTPHPYNLAFQRSRGTHGSRRIRRFRSLRAKARGGR